MIFKKIDKTDLYKKLIEKFGEKQIIVAIEELSELQKELCKNMRGRENKDSIVEEVADVLIMIEQIILYYDLSEIDILALKQLKLERTEKLLEV